VHVDDLPSGEGPQHAASGAVPPTRSIPQSVRAAGRRDGFAPPAITLPGESRRPDLVQLTHPLSGYYELSDERAWSHFAPFESAPNLDWRDPNLKFIDPSGDGRADVVVSEDHVFACYPSLREAAFGPAEPVSKALEEEAGPAPQSLAVGPGGVGARG
jgi:hypothetical protein